jgi:hypothetical protein
VNRSDDLAKNRQFGCRERSFRDQPSMLLNEKGSQSLPRERLTDHHYDAVSLRLADGKPGPAFSE